MIRYAICFNRGTDREFFYCQGAQKINQWHLLFSTLAVSMLKRH